MFLSPSPSLSPRPSSLSKTNEKCPQVRIHKMLHSSIYKVFNLSAVATLAWIALACAGLSCASQDT